MTIPWMMNCPHQDSGWCLDCVKTMGEELSVTKTEVERLRGRWVSAAANLPQEGIPVLARVRWRMCDGWKYRTIRAQYAGQYSLEAADDNDDSDYDENTDQYYAKEGWYEDNEFEETHWRVGGEVTHWMALPEPPEKE